ncbi:MAG: lipoprotein [Xanthomonadales bacterium]|nr:lipoprotein [Xanthomonadales bacterium]
MNSSVRTRSILLLLSAATFLLAACGNKGDLYLPEQPPALPAEESSGEPSGRNTPDSL